MQTNKKSSNTSSDAFAWLNNNSSSSSSANGVSMAERMAQQKSTLGSSSLNTQGQNKNQAADLFDFDLLDKKSPSPQPSTSMSASSSSPNPPPSNSLVDFDFGESLSAQPKQYNNNTTSNSKDSIFDDDFGTAVSVPAATKSATASASATSAFMPNDYDDILGELGKPVAPKQTNTSSSSKSSLLFEENTGNSRNNSNQKQQQQQQPYGDLLDPTPSRTPSRRPSSSSITSSNNNNHNNNNQRRNTPSPQPSASPSPSFSSTSSSSQQPPPHILGQLVEMGFDIEASGKALKKTRHPEPPHAWDVEAAIELMVGSRPHRPSPSSSTQQRHGSRSRQHTPDQARDRNNNSNNDNFDDRLNPQQQHDGDQDQSDLLAQASQIGLNVFQKANTFWNTSRAQIQKAIDEQMQQHAQSRQQGLDPSLVARPKWMTDSVERSTEDEQEITQPRQKQQQQQQQQQRTSANNNNKPNQERQQQQDLFDMSAMNSNMPTLSSSPQTPSRPKQSWLGPSSSASASSSSLSSKPNSTKKPSITRRPRAQNNVTATSEQLARFSRFKKVGNEKFGLGQFGGAHEAYSQALAALPVSHIERIVVLNNRALARTKSGMSKEAKEDCNAVILSILKANEQDSSDDIAEIIDTIDIESSMVIQSTIGPQEKPINLIDQLVKAFVQRARAAEATERWKEAKLDWQLLRQSNTLSLGVKSPQLRSIINQGISRCDSALNPSRPPPPSSSSSSSSSSSASKPTPSRKPPAPAPSSSVSSGKAVKTLRAQNDAQAREDAEKFELQVSIDEKISAWKTGKETNVRALMASLDTVLWPEKAKEVKTGMHELVTPAQVKRKYMITVAKLHPDKLPPATTPLEHRLLANSVFASLNEAWVNSK